VIAGLYGFGFSIAALAKATLLSESGIETWRLAFLPILLVTFVVGKFFYPLSDHIKWLSPE